MFTFEDYQARTSRFDIFKFKCKKCGLEFESFHCNGVHDRCPICWPVSTCKSKGQKELAEYVKSLGINVVENDRSVISPLELDIYVPDHKLAIEFNGVYWHSDAHNTDPYYHANKTDLCEQLGIRLVHVFESEWMNKQHIVKACVKRCLGMHDEVLDAYDDCFIKEITEDEALSVLHENSMSDIWSSDKSFALFSDNDNSIVAVMSFAKMPCASEWIVQAYCEAKGIHVMSGAARLYERFEHECNPECIVMASADRRWDTGDMYEQLGFSFCGTTPQMQWYVVHSERR